MSAPSEAHAILLAISEVTSLLAADSKAPDQMWVQRSFKLSLSQAVIVDAMIAKYALFLVGNNLAGRALEAICILASLEPDLEKLPAPSLQSTLQTLDLWQEL